MQTRYYDPEVGRFINADGLDYLGEGAELSNYNLFAYCGNNPVIFYDLYGHIFVFAVDVEILPPSIEVPDISVPSIPGMGAPFDIYLSPNPYPFGNEILDQIQDQELEINNPGSILTPDISMREIKIPAARKYFPTKKAAEEAARRAGGGKDPRLDPGKDGQPPHYHPNVKQEYKTTPKGVSKHDHYYFPKRRYIVVIDLKEQLNQSDIVPQLYTNMWYED